jgi:excisionase family DNA binding protein
MARIIEKPMAVSIPELARLTGISEGLLYIKANSGGLPGCRRIGKRFLVHLETFENYLKSGTGEEMGRQDA